MLIYKVLLSKRIFEVKPTRLKKSDRLKQERGKLKCFFPWEFIITENFLVNNLRSLNSKYFRYTEELGK